MIKYLNEYQVMEAYFQVLNWGKYALKEFKVWQIDQIKKYAERKLISIPERIEDYEKMKLNLSEVNLLTFQGQEKDNRSDNRKMFEINKTIFKLSNDLSNAYLVLNYIRDFNVELIKEDSKKNADEKTIIEFSDILEVKYKSIEDEIFAVLGKCFPEFYNENGKALNNRKNIKAILNSWYKLLFKDNFISLNPTNQQKEQISQILNDRCKFVNGKLSSKTLFVNDGIEFKLNSEYRTMQNLIKSLKIN